jgi:Uma2 family endonuclease
VTRTSLTASVAPRVTLRRTVDLRQNRVDMSSAARVYLTPEEYLAIEREADHKSEYLNGEMFAMAGASLYHGLAVSNLVAGLVPRLRPRGCSVVSNDLRLRVSPTGLYTYPDVMVLCEKPRFVDDRNDTVVNPILIAEVLSASTEAYDRGEKFAHYRTLESFQEYLLVAQDRVSIEQFVRQPDGRWLLTAVNRMEDVLELPSIGCQLPVSEVYEQVDLVSTPRRTTLNVE